MAQLELTSATSEDVYEVWDGKSIVRVMEAHAFQEISLQMEAGRVGINKLFHNVTDTHIPRFSDPEDGLSP